VSGDTLIIAGEGGESRLGTNEQLGLGLESDAEWVAGISFRKGRVLRQALRLAIVASHEEPRWKSLAAKVRRSAADELEPDVYRPARSLVRGIHNRNSA
jgi:hypothetical protein